MFLSGGLSSSIRHFHKSCGLTCLLSPGLGSKQLEFKALIILIIGFKQTSAPTRHVENVVLATGKKHTTVGWYDGGKIGKIINYF